MFREITISKQAGDGPKRRWYQSDYFDLYVFYIRHSERMDKHADREFVGMQLCYDIRRRQRTLEWKKIDGFSHHSVKKGGDTLSDHGASVALLQKGGEFDSAKVIDVFMRDSTTLPGLIKTFVLQKLTEYAKLNPRAPPTAAELAAAAAAANVAEQIAAQVEAEAAAYAAEQAAQVAQVAALPAPAEVMRRSSAAPPPPTMSAGEYELFTLDLPVTPVAVVPPPAQSTPVAPKMVDDAESFSLDGLLKP